LRANHNGESKDLASGRVGSPRPVPHHAETAGGVQAGALSTRPGARRSAARSEDAAALLRQALLSQRRMHYGRQKGPRIAEGARRPAAFARRAPGAGGACRSGLRLASGGLRAAEGGDMSQTVYERFETNADFQAAVDRLLE